MNTSNVTNFENAFSNCSKLLTVDEIDTSNATSISSMFYRCEKLTDLCEIDTTKCNPSYVSEYNNPLYYCRSLRNFGGFKNYSVNLYAKDAYVLSYESLMNVINKLADGVSGKTLYLHQDCVNMLSDDDIAIATNKGWSISPAKTITGPVVVTNLSQIPMATHQINPRLYDFSQYSGSARLPCVSYLQYFDGDFSNSTNIESMFSGNVPLKSAKLTNTSNITNMNRLFNDCRDMEHLYIADTSNVTSMVYMLYGCKNLKDTNISE